MNTRGLTIVQVLLLAIVAAVLAFVSLPFYSRHKTRIRVRKAVCINNLKQVGLGLEIYASEQYYGSLPDAKPGIAYSDTLAAALYDSGNGIIGDPKVFVCPSREETEDAAAGALRCDYVFNPHLADGAEAVKAMPANTVLAADKAGNHDDGACMLYKDVHIKFVKFKTFTAEDYAAWVKAFTAGKDGAEFGPEAWVKAREKNRGP